MEHHKFDHQQLTVRQTQSIYKPVDQFRQMVSTLKYLNEESTRRWWPEGYVTRHGCKCQKKVSFRRKHTFWESRVQREWTNAVVCPIKFRCVGVDTLNEIVESFNVVLARTSACLDDQNLWFSFQRRAPLSLKFPHERSYTGRPVIHTQNAISVIAMRHNNENESRKLVVVSASILLGYSLDLILFQISFDNHFKSKWFKEISQPFFVLSASFSISLFIFLKLEIVNDNTVSAAFCIVTVVAAQWGWTYKS